MALSTMIRGTLLLTAATFLSKLLGIIYVIPFNALLGEDGGALFSYAYVPYNILISISTIGIPLGVSKFVSKYNGIGDYQTSQRVFRTGMSIMAVTGMVAFLVMYFGADLIAQWSVGNSEKGFSAESVAYVIKLVSFANLIIPAMSIVRGFFQGNQSMGPTAVSQVVEQIVRIVFLLLSVYLALHVFHQNVVVAVGYATFAAFIGALASCAVLYVYWTSRKSHLNRIIAEQKVKPASMTDKSIIKELLSYAGPFVVTGIATSLYQFIDQFTMKRALIAIGQSGDVADSLFGIVNFYGQKIITIPMTLSIGLSLAAVPAITRAFFSDNRKLYLHQINQSIQIVLFLILPASIGIALLGNEAYTAFYGPDAVINLGAGTLMMWYAPVALLFALFTTTSSILQGINEQRFSVISLTAGLLAKIFFNIPLIHAFGAKGAIFGTALAVGIATISNFVRIKYALRFPMRQLVKRTILILIFTAIMSVLVIAVKFVLGFVLSYEDGKIAATIIILVCAFVGGSVYLLLAYKSTLLERVLGNRIGFLDRLLKRKKG
ncbi:Membrane protein involved in the export of O-antigen and teichoic acid [Terribacillus saccharophilus]|uniref:Membrane protein involved in the export of O-antigen and teichoic acid n=1 Tax=Terribacillus saccharophilus TaxID=361277 RepID=A0AAX2E870_9BACI|nr:Membrane protein involved in the export of O-antigen and teichoic acid [Terribacillus saccharophilus]